MKKSTKVSSKAEQLRLVRNIVRELTPSDLTSAVGGQGGAYPTNICPTRSCVQISND